MRFYLDYNSTTPVDERVLEAMMPWFREKFGNAASNTHVFGWEASAAVDLAREQVARFINSEPGEIIFTSGATEAINLALRGTAEMYRSKGNHIITCQTEHKAVLDTCKALEQMGFDITYLPVSRDGSIDTDDLQSRITNQTVLVCIMMANNETGVVQDTGRIGSICRNNNVMFLTDATQAAGKLRIDVKEQNISLACISAHKFYGPKGTGALYISRKNPRVNLVAQITGGGHEKGYRSGTLNVPGIIGTGKAAEIANAELWNYADHTSALRTYFEQQLQENCNAVINGNRRDRLPNTTNLLFRNIRSSSLIKHLPEIAFSTGSACSSALPEPSHVLTAMGLSDSEAYSSCRFSLGKYTTMEEVSYAVNKITDAIRLLAK